MQTHTLTRTALGCMAFTALFVAGCGGGGSASTPTSVSEKLAGLAATGAGIANAAITARCAVGPAVTGTTDAGGNYTLSLGSSATPCMVQVVGGTTPVTLFSFAQTAGRVNITPATDMVVTRALGADPSVQFATFNTAMGATINGNLAAAKIYVSKQFGDLAGTALALDPITGVFAVGDAHDKVLDAFGAAVAAAGKAIGDLRSGAIGNSDLLAVIFPPLAAPANPTAAANSTSQITLSWDAVPRATGYQVFKATAASAVNVAGTAAGTTNTTTFVDTGLTASTAYFYKVVAINPKSTGANATTEITATTSAATTGTGFTCDTSKFAAGAPVASPSAAQVNSFAKTYTGSEGSYDNAFLFTASGSATLVFNADGTATYNGTGYVPSSYCLETLSGGAGTQLVIHSGATSHFDLKTSGAWSGSSVSNKVVKDTAYVPPVSSGIAGITWTAANAVAGDSCRSFKAAVQGGGKWVAVGDSGCIRTSSNGVDWSAGSQLVTDTNLLDVTYANGRYVAVGTSGRSQTSVNGIDWTQSTQTAPRANMYAVIWTGSRFLAATDQSGSSSSGFSLYSSTDGTSWTGQKITTDTSVGSNSLYLTGIAANGNTLVAVGGATTNCVAWRSTDGGSNWTSVGSKTCGQTPSSHDGKFQLGSGMGENSALSVAYGNGKFVAIGALGSWASSTDGVTWTTGAIDASGGVFVRPYRIYFDGSQFVVVGNQRRVYTSTDGQTWTTRNIDSTVAYNTANNFYGVAGTGTGRLVVVGHLASDGAGFKTSVP